VPVFVPDPKRGGSVPAGVVGGAKATGGSVPVGVVGGSQPVGKVDMSRVNATSGGVFVPDGGKVDMSRVNSGGVFVPSGGRARPDVVTPIAQKKGGGGSFLGGLGHLADKTASGLYHAAVNLPGGLYTTGRAVAHDFGTGIVPAFTGKKAPPSHLNPILKAQGKSFVSSAEHPLRDPAATLLNLGAVASLGAGSVARAGAVGRAVGEGASVGDVAKAALTKPAPGVRTLRSGGVTATAPASRAALTRGITKASDAAMQRWAKEHPEGRVATTRLPKKVGKWNAQQARVAVAVGQGPALALQRLGRRLTLPEQTALQVAAEGVPLREQLAFAEKQLASATSKQAARRHQVNVNLLRKAAPLINDSGAAPRLLPAHLQRVYGETVKVSQSTDRLRENMGLITPEASRARISAPGRIVRGAEYERTPAVKGRVEQTRLYPGRSKTVTRPRTAEEARAALSAVEAQHEAAVQKLMPAGKLSPEELKARQTETRIRNRARTSGGKSAPNWDPLFRNEDAGAGRYLPPREGAAGGVHVSTILQEDRAYAEQQLARMLAEHAGHPLAQRYAAGQALAEQLRGALNPLPGEARGDLGQIRDGRGRDRRCWRPPAQIPACASNAPGSCLGFWRRSVRLARGAGCGAGVAIGRRDDASASRSCWFSGCGAGAHAASAG
jgi:hypothetical protein